MIENNNYDLKRVTYLEAHVETAQERVKLLKTGLSEKEIERLYVEHNNFKIIRTSILYEANEFDIAPSIIDNEGYFNPEFPLN